MSIDEQRRGALADLRELLAQGVPVEEAIDEAATANGLRPDVVAKIGSQLIAVRDKLIETKRLADAKSDRTRRAEKAIKLYRAALEKDPDADFAQIEAEVGVEDFSKDEEGTLFLKSLDAWLDSRL